MFMSHISCASSNATHLYKELKVLIKKEDYETALILSKEIQDNYPLTPEGQSAKNDYFFVESQLISIAKAIRKNDVLKIRFIQNNLNDFYKQKGMYPLSLFELENMVSAPQYLDYWGRAFFYSKTNEGYSISSLGRDGYIGGIFSDEDLIIEGKPSSEEVNPKGLRPKGSKR